MANREFIYWCKDAISGIRYWKIRNKVLVLPNKYYTDEELQLIFNHEIIHIARDDVFTKIYIVFCNACCWFNPLMWLANKKCSEDLELSCDTSVLANEEDVLRKQKDAASEEAASGMEYYSSFSLASAMIFAWLILGTSS